MSEQGFDDCRSECYAAERRDDDSMFVGFVIATLLASVLWYLGITHESVVRTVAYAVAILTTMVALFLRPDGLCDKCRWPARYDCHHTTGVTSYIRWGGVGATPYSASTFLRHCAWCRWETREPGVWFGPLL